MRGSLTQGGGKGRGHNNRGVGEGELRCRFEIFVVTGGRGEKL